MSEPRRRHAPATSRNRDPILAVLRRCLPERGLILEVASGTGEHAAYFAAQLPGITWQPTDHEAAQLESIRAWRQEAQLANLREPQKLSATAAVWPVAAADAIVCINMIHIAPWAACEGLLDGAARILPDDGLLYLYGPFRIGGVHISESNAAFDAGLRAQDPAWGVRDLDEVAARAAVSGLRLVEVVEMPSNNRSVLFRRGRR